jgi:hypothetical protein
VSGTAVGKFAAADALTIDSSTGKPISIRNDNGMQNIGVFGFDSDAGVQLYIDTVKNLTATGLVDGFYGDKWDFGAQKGSDGQWQVLTVAWTRTLHTRAHPHTMPAHTHTHIHKRTRARTDSPSLALARSPIPRPLPSSSSRCRSATMSAATSRRPSRRGGTPARPRRSQRSPHTWEPGRTSRAPPRRQRLRSEARWATSKATGSRAATGL